MGFLSLSRFLGTVRKGTGARSMGLWAVLMVIAFGVAIALQPMALAVSLGAHKIEIAIDLPLEPWGDTDLALDAREMLRGTQMYIDEINRGGGVHGHRLKLNVFTSRGSGDRTFALEQAQKIAESRAIAVLGGYYSSLTIPAGKIYKQAQIPAVTAIAAADQVTQGNDFFFRVIPNVSWRTAFIASYMYQVLGYNNISLVTDPTDEGFSLSAADNFTQTFEELGGTIDNTWLLPQQSPQAIATEIVSHNPEIVFLALQAEQITPIIKATRQRGFNNPFFIAAASWNAESLANTPEEQTTPGSLSHDVYMTAQLIYDVASQTALEFRSQYAQRYNNEQPRWLTAISYDATKALVSAIQHSNITGQPLLRQKERLQVRAALANINSPKTAIDALSGQIYFNKNGDFETAPAVGTFQSRQLVSAFRQLKINPIFLPIVENALQEPKDSETYQNFLQTLADEKILLVNQLPMKVAHVIYTGVDINNVLAIDQKESTYKIDLYLWFKYEKQPDIEPRMVEFITASEIIELPENPLQKIVNEEVVEANHLPQEGDIVTEAYRINSQFQEPFEFYDYPFDTQRLAIRLRHQFLDRSELIYVIDLLGMRDINADQTAQDWQQQKVFATITDWQLKRVLFFPDVLSNRSTLGFNSEITNPRLEYSRFNAIIEVERNRTAFLLKNLLPLIFFLFVGYTNFFIPLSQIKFAAVTSLLMAVVFFHLNLLNKLPERVGYIVALDYGFYVIYGLLGFQILLFVISYNPKIQENPVYLKRLMIVGRIVYPTIIVGVFAATLWAYG